MNRQAQKNNADVVYGIQSVLESLNAEHDIDKLFVQKNLKSDQLKEIMRRAEERQVHINKVPVEKLNRITRKNHQGVIAFISAVNFASLENVIAATFESGKTPLILVLDQITDVRNFGAIARTAECTGADCLLVPERGRAQIGSDAMKTSSGALNYIPVCRTGDLKKSIQYIKDSGINIVVATEKAEEYAFEHDLTLPTAIVVGSEEYGVSEDIQLLANASVKIPIHGQVGSMNVSVAAGIVMYEAIRQRK